MTDLSKKTIEYYNQNAVTFYEGTVNADMSYVMSKFCAYLEEMAAGKEPIKVIDAGCGSGRDIKAFIERGYSVRAFDASSEMARMAGELSGIEVECRTFSDVNEICEYDGVWACASLLHVPREELEGSIMKLRDALKENGVLYMSFKCGDSERTKDGRFFCDMTEEQVVDILNRLKMKPLEIFITGDVREGRGDERWINVIAGKKN